MNFRHWPGSIVVIALLGAALMGCNGKGGNCTRKDCDTDDDCRGKRVCRVSLLGPICIEPNAERCDLGEFGRATRMLDPDEPVFPLPFEAETTEPPQEP